MSTLEWLWTALKWLCGGYLCVLGTAVTVMAWTSFRDALRGGEAYRNAAEKIEERLRVIEAKLKQKGNKNGK